MANERVKEAIQWLLQNGYASSQKELAERIDYNPATVSMIANGRIGRSLPKFARALKKLSGNIINDYWICSGKGDMLQDPEADAMNSSALSRISIVEQRDVLESQIAGVLLAFRNRTGVTVDSIQCEYIPDKELYNISIPLNIPSCGSACRKEDND